MYYVWQKEVVYIRQMVLFSRTEDEGTAEENDVQQVHEISS